MFFTGHELSEFIENGRIILSGWKRMSNKIHPISSIKDDPAVVQGSESADQITVARGL